eukprot:1139547-Pelagomonas_calceolata.AAC.6
MIHTAHVQSLLSTCIISHLKSKAVLCISAPNGAHLSGRRPEVELAGHMHHLTAVAQELLTLEAIGHGVQQPGVQHPEHRADEHKREGVAQELQATEPTKGNRACKIYEQQYGAWKAFSTTTCAVPITPHRWTYGGETLHSAGAARTETTRELTLNTALMDMGGEVQHSAGAVLHASCKCAASSALLAATVLLNANQHLPKWRSSECTPAARVQQRSCKH